MSDDLTLSRFLTDEGLHTIPTLVDERLLTREAGRYWRSGGTVDV